jgi:ribosome-associated translation inhibitor RaiA
MQTPLQITFRNMEHSDAVEARVRELAEKLDHYFDRITACHVVIEAPHRHHHKGKLYQVNITLAVPGSEIAIGHSGRKNHAHEDVYVADSDSFKAAKRQLEDYVRKSRGDVKTHAAPADL